MQMCKSVLAKELLVQDREQMLKNTNNAQNPINSPNTVAAHLRAAALS